jgi:hypothetical protein
MERASFSLRDRSPKATPRKGDEFGAPDDSGSDNSNVIEHTKFEIKTLGQILIESQKPKQSFSRNLHESASQSVYFQKIPPSLATKQIFSQSFVN